MAARLNPEIHHHAAFHLAIEDRFPQTRQIFELRAFDHGIEFIHGEVLGEAGPGGLAAEERAGDGIYPEQRDMAQDEGDHRGLELGATGEAAGGDGAVIFDLRQDGGEG